MKNSRCPYHVKQGVVDAQGKLILSDVCGVRTACGAACTYAPFVLETHKKCQRFLAYTQGTDRQVSIPKNEIEYLPELNNVDSFSEIELL
jgi:hypothetical protein